MAEVVEKREHEEALKRIAALESELLFIKSLLMAEQWFSREQAMKVLDVSETTLWRLTKERRLQSEKDGRKIRYQVDSIRSYLTGKNFEAAVIDNRIISACRA